MTKAQETWRKVEAVAPHTRRVLLYGPPGTGKSYIAREAGLKHGQATYPVPVHPDLAAVELRGHYVQGESGTFEWRDGPAVAAWRSGGRLILDEVDRAGDDALSFLLGVLDDHATAKLVLSTTGEVIAPHKNFTVWATMNGEPEDLPEALADRFPVTVRIDSANPKAIAALPEDLRRMATSLTAHPDEERRIGLRSFLEFASLRAKVDLELAADVVFGPRAPEVLDALRLAGEVDKR